MKRRKDNENTNFGNWITQARNIKKYIKNKISFDKKEIVEGKVA